MEWSEHAARYLVLITDAGPRPGTDPLSSTGLDAKALRQIARDKGVAIFVLHLLTESNKADHEDAAKQYRELARFPGIGSLYYAVPTGDVGEFWTCTRHPCRPDHHAGANGRRGHNRYRSAGEPIPNANPRLAELQSKVAKLGYALRMEHLQRQLMCRIDTHAVRRMLLLDRDIRDPQRACWTCRSCDRGAFRSARHSQGVLETAEEGLLSPQNFLNELKSLAATIARDPEQLGSTTATTAGEGNSLADLGFMREYIEDLPYTGEVMDLSLEDWETWPARRQIEFFARLRTRSAITVPCTTIPISG